jgi:hypothetical protein
MISPARAALVPILLSLGCTSSTRPPLCVFADPPVRAVQAGRPAQAADYRYRVSTSPGGEELCVEVDLPGAAGRWVTEAEILPFVRDVVAGGGGGFSPVGSGDGAWLVPGCGADHGCRLRYRILLAEAARALADYDLALLHRGAIVSPASTWLLRPLASRGPFQLTVATPPGTSYVNGLTLAPSGGYAGDVGALDDTPYAAFGPLAVRTVSLPGGSLDVAITPDAAPPASRAAIDAWVDRSARAVASYYGRLPIAHGALVLLLQDKAGVGTGHTMGDGGGTMLVQVGARSLAADLEDDWVLVHEMVHLSSPDVRVLWAEEGLATYLEPIIRVRAWLIEPDEVWQGLFEGLPQGQPQAGDGGLDGTDSWGRTYWGGAMFWLLADVEIRKRTQNRRSLDDALLGVSRAGGNDAVRWDLDRMLAVGDEATGAPVLVALRHEQGSRPVTFDLPALWRSLGVSMDGKRMVYDDAAPLAAIRRAISARASSASSPVPEHADPQTPAGAKTGADRARKVRDPHRCVPRRQRRGGEKPGR